MSAESGILSVKKFIGTLEILYFHLCLHLFYSKLNLHWKLFPPLVCTVDFSAVKFHIVTYTHM